MDVRFLAELNKGGPTQMELGRELCTRLLEKLDCATAATPLLRYEDCIAAMAAIFIHYCLEARYDPAGVTEILMTQYPPNYTPRRPGAGPDKVNS